MSNPCKMILGSIFLFLPLLACSGDDDGSTGAGGGSGGGTGGGGAMSADGGAGGGGGGGGGAVDADAGADGAIDPDGGADASPPPNDDAGVTGLPTFAAVGYGGRRVVSDDGTFWIHDVDETEPGGDDDQLLRDVTFGEDLIVAVGGSAHGRVMWSSDGVSWEERTDGVNWLGGVAYGGGRFVAVGGLGRRAYSDDGKTWVDGIVDFEAPFRAIAFGDGVFVAVGDGGRRIRTVDGVTWTDDLSGGVNLGDVAYGNGYFVAVGQNGRRVRSADGATWEDEFSGTGTLSCVVFAAERFLAVGGLTAYESQDGEEWTARTLNESIDEVAYADGVYVGARWTEAGTTFLRSTDGLNWWVMETSGNAITALAGATH
jgi:hypothetical protein